MKNILVPPRLVKHIAHLARLPLSSKEVSKFSSQLSSVLDYMGQLSHLKLDTKKTSTHVELTNVTREDVIDPQRMLTQKQALSQARKTHKGYFVVKAVFH